MDLTKLLSEKTKAFHRLVSLLAADYRCQSPRQIDIELSNRCNLRCKMCWFHGESGVGDRYQGKEFSTEQVFALVDQLAQYNPALRIYIGGGEPFVREDFPAILRHIKSRGLSASFTTNGTLIAAEQIEELVAIGVDAVSFSIDGYGELHDLERGAGVFEKVTQCVKSLSLCRSRRGCTKPLITVNVTLTDQLMGQLAETLQAIREATADGADFYRIHHQWYVSPDELSAHQSLIEQKLGCPAPGAAGHLLQSSRILDPHTLAEEIETIRCQPKIRMFPDMEYKDVVNYYSEKPRIRKRCVAPLLGAVIKPDGNVTFCPDEWIDGYILGNVRDHSFEEIWNNERARKFRAVLMKQKHFEGCNRCSWMYSY
jgi:radical SAM protein with 4Fe4S-binding SPASM domain